MKLKSVYVCSECGHETPKWFGKCPSCENYNTFVEEVVEKEKKVNYNFKKPESLKEIKSMSENRISTKIAELDRVLSGGIVEGSLILVGGDPGIGKSTLLLQICQSIGDSGKDILYVSGEESNRQIKLRAERLSITTEKLLILSETNIGIIEESIRKVNPKLVIIDSIQTMFREEIASVPGSVSQVRESTQTFMKIAKSLNISIIIVGHVTKEGALAGPKVLEHMVDTVLYFEGEKGMSYRIIRAVKNRFGSTNEIGVFEMKEKGLVEIKNPSEYMLLGRPLGVPGSSVTCNIEGTRPILTEIQALVCPTSFGMPRRMASGLDYNRVVMLMAVLEKRAGLALGTYDSYVNVAGGLKITETSIDAAVVASILSSYKNKFIDPYLMVFGEVGLTGEIRAVPMAEKRVAEAGKLGFKKCVLPKANVKSLKNIGDIEIKAVNNIVELLEFII